LRYYDAILFVTLASSVVIQNNTPRIKAKDDKTHSFDNPTNIVSNWQRAGTKRLAYSGNGYNMGTVPLAKLF